MKAIYGSTLISDGALQGTRGFGYNGQQFNDAVDFFRAVSRKWFPRERTRTISFAVTHSYSSLHLAERAAIEQFEIVAQQDTLSLFIGTEADGEWVRFEDATLDSVRSTYIGTSPAFEYTFLVGAPSFSQPAPSYTEPTSEMIQRGKEAIPDGATEMDVEFDTPFATVPIVMVSVAIPALGSRIEAFLVDGSETETGFSVEFSAPLPAGTYKLIWWANV